MSITDLPGAPDPFQTYEDVLTLVLLTKSKLPAVDPEVTKLLDQAALRLCYLIGNHPSCPSPRYRQIFQLRSSLSRSLAGVHSLLL